MSQSKINFAFWGTPDVASETLEILKANGFLPSAIITSPDAKAGRGMQMQASPVAKFAEENNIECIKPGKLPEIFSSDKAVDARGVEKKLQAVELFVVVAYGKIIPEEILNIPKLGSINIHYSILPKYRGASPVESAILNGDTETGVTIQKMVYEMDAGAIIAQEKIQINPDEKAHDLRRRLIRLGGEMLVKLLNESKFDGMKQDESEATFCKKIKKEDGLIDLNADPVVNYNKFRAYATWPRTYFFKPARNAEGIASAGGDDKRIIITDAELIDGKFIIKKIIPEGGKEIEYRN